ncbi:hypothetical protein [Halocatena pleomorpha]|uniref:Uncharacterized protein n=1 Tax=Halocatena pleomorpha TaxID=1785090 RepID=A0A3P3R9E4_9EURY|nr:hypothetical protein [Halocatena pleomorpha]RRJ29935.1 hypothetical protein EIK79_11300 [Halocatena pleomorpha]
MTTDNRQNSQTITIELGPTFGSSPADVAQIRNSQVSWLGEMAEAEEPIFAIERPLEIAGVAASQSTQPHASSQPAPSMLTFVPAGEPTIRGIPPDVHVRSSLGMHGHMDMSVDSLSRSVLLTDIDERTLIDEIRTKVTVATDSLTALNRDLLVPELYESFDKTAATRATALLKENIRRHEREHVRCLLDPDTALWKEFELYVRSILIGAEEHTWTDLGFLDRLATLYATPSRFTVELLGRLAEDYTMADPTIQRAVESRVAAQRGSEATLWQFMKDHHIDLDRLEAMLRSPVGEQYCDLWLAYIIDELRAGNSLEEITAASFYRNCTPTATPYDAIVADSETRSMYVDLMRERLRGPVIEVVRLKRVEGTFTLERAWYSLNPNVANDDSLLAVRRTLFRRQFLSTFSAESGLGSLRAEREAGVERIIQDASLTDSSVFDISLPPSNHIAQCLPAACETAATTLLGPTASIEDLTAWLNEPQFELTE